MLKRNLGNRFVAKVKVEGKFSPAKASNVGFILKNRMKKINLQSTCNLMDKLDLIKFEDGKKSILKSVKLSEPPTDEFEMAVKVDNRRISFMVDGKVLKQLMIVSKVESLVSDLSREPIDLET